MISSCELISIFSTLVMMFTLSSAQPFWERVIFCFTDVKKPVGLKKPVSQKAFGSPVFSHFSHSWNCTTRLIRSPYQEPSEFRSQEMDSHFLGTLAS